MKPYFYTSNKTFSLEDISRSYEKYLGTKLVEESNLSLEEALFELDAALLAHGLEADPILCYSNKLGMKVFEISSLDLGKMPSRLTAELSERSERELLLKSVAEQGYINNYSGIRVSKKGKRFRINSAIVWNITSLEGEYLGQAACFSNWDYC